MFPSPSLSLFSVPVTASEVNHVLIKISGDGATRDTVQFIKNQYLNKPSKIYAIPHHFLSKRCSCDKWREMTPDQAINSYIREILHNTTKTLRSRQMYSFD